MSKCGCGCGGQPRGRKALFCMGHDMRLRGRLIREWLEGSADAWKLAEEHGWGRFLDEASTLRDRKQAEFAVKAKKNPKLQTLGRAPDGSIVAFYLNANGTRVLEFVDRYGKKHWKHLPPKEQT